MVLPKSVMKSFRTKKCYTSNGLQFMKAQIFNALSNPNEMSLNEETGDKV